ncbi:unnamed protein product [Symbiodinium natans]|uniref:Uncharacterized protein n=1 Tax=Symbiodinium natans TaxID=878477 RepID=A0A812R5R8_9DINO|nr:unnamed protein product [Symbiodinium natans]
MSFKDYQALLDEDGICEELCEILDMDKDELLAAWEGFPKENRQMYGGHHEIVARDNFVDSLMKAKGAVDLLSVTRVYQKLARIEKALRVPTS